jgi:prepilin-type N-terminal cleavage/methylation domain-containing protein
MSRHRPSSGFTLIELMVSITVVGILLALGVPSFARIYGNERMATQTNELVTLLNLRAPRRCAAASRWSRDERARASIFARGWQMYTDPNGDKNAADGTVAAAGRHGAWRTTIKRSRARARRELQLRGRGRLGDRPAVRRFNPRWGHSADQAIFFRVVCDASDHRLPGRIVQVSDHRAHLARQHHRHLQLM